MNIGYVEKKDSQNLNQKINNTIIIIFKIIKFVNKVALHD